jgi:protein-disulfide isomerase
MSTNAKLTGLFAIAVLGVALAIVFIQFRSSEPSAGVPDSVAASTSDLLVRDDSHYLSTAEDGRVTIVEFLDFECEACLAMFPVMEQLRQDYAGEITFVVRYFPLPGHPNSVTAATAVEAAAQQGAFEAMYRKMFETQEQWGHSQASQKPLFLQYAGELGLDVGQFERTMDDPATKARVQRDVDDGLALGVTGTPTIYINGVATEPMPSYGSLTASIDAALEQGQSSQGSGAQPHVASHHMDARRRWSLTA